MPNGSRPVKTGSHDAARVSLMLHQTHENWEASRDFPRFSDACMSPTLSSEASEVSHTGECNKSHFSTHLRLRTHVTIRAYSLSKDVAAKPLSRSSAITWYVSLILNDTGWPVQFLPLTCLYHPSLYSRQQASLSLTIKPSLTALLYIVATVVVPCGSLLHILETCHSQRTSCTTYSESNWECCLFPPFPLSHPLMLFIGKGYSCPTWQEIFWICLCRSTLWVLLLTIHLLPSTHWSSMFSSGMRGLPALIWDGSVLDPGRLLHPWSGFDLSSWQPSI